MTRSETWACGLRRFEPCRWGRGLVRFGDLAAEPDDVGAVRPGVAALGAGGSFASAVPLVGHGKGPVCPPPVVSVERRASYDL
jgi:hypothetical protein